MSDDSLYSKHLRLIQQDESQWTPSDREEFDRLQTLRLPPLELKPTAWMKFKQQFKITIPALATASIAIIGVVTLMRQPNDILAPKGSIQVSVVWERAGKVSSLTVDSELKDGDKIGASVVSSDESVAYWAITDDKFKPIVEMADIESSKILLEPGVSKRFDSSFELVAPNQGESLVVIVCPKSKINETTKPVESLFDQQFTVRLLADQQIRSSDCMFAGYRLRRSP